jgi:hypothetical protein
VRDYRPLTSTRQILLRLDGRGVSAMRKLDVVVRRSDATGPAFLLMVDTGTRLPIELRDVYPTVMTVFSIKLRTWAAGLVQQLLDDLDAKAREAYRAQT